jgi:1,2-diacylglycerol 3-alpha-glucosyltransferase
MSLSLAISFSNLGPYHLARLRALARRLSERSGRLIAYETAGTEQLYPWQTDRRADPFERVTLFPDRSVEAVPRADAVREMWRVLDRDQPDAVATAGYYRPETMAALDWARRAGRPAILMSESQAIDHPRVWWKETIKGRRVRRFSAALVGGERHRDYLIELGMPADRIALGYNAVDNEAFREAAAAARRNPHGRRGLPEAPYFLAVNRFVPEKNLPRLIRAFAAYRAGSHEGQPWDLVLCGDGPGASEVDAAIRRTGRAASIHRPGFLQLDGLTRWYAHASAFVHPSLMEPWGLVVNEAAACGLPLLVSDHAGCVETLVPRGNAITGARFDPACTDQIAACLRWIATLPDPERRAIGARAAERVSGWGPDRFAIGMLEALDRAGSFRRRVSAVGAG